MKYIIDTNILIPMFRYYYFDRFPSFWEKFNDYMNNNIMCSVREVKNEINEKDDELKNWGKKHSSFFHKPTVSELKFITQIYAVQHFQSNLERRKLLKGGAFADPFVIAKAYQERATVITAEVFKENGAKIPNICAHFNVECINFEKFLVLEDWIF